MINIPTGEFIILYWPSYMIQGLIMIFGLCVGSFLNVCIYRIPLESWSIIKPTSSVCLHCKEKIHFFDNIPVLSYIFLRGKCRHCKTHISIRYPIVEILSGLFAICLIFRFGFTIDALIYYCLICALLVITFIDIDYQIIPNVISIPGIPIGFICALFLKNMDWQSSLIGLLGGGGILFCVAYTYLKIKKIEGIGLGDVKLLAMLGAFLGLKGVLFIIFMSSAIGTLSGIIVMIHERKATLKLAIPFGPFLSLAAMLYIFWGDVIVYYYVVYIN